MTVSFWNKSKTLIIVGATPLQIAVINNNLDGVQILLQNNADVNITDKDGKDTFSLQESALSLEIPDILLVYCLQILH